MKGYIYKYTFPNSKVYIGQTRTSVKERHYQHMYASKHKHLATVVETAIAKYGEPQLDVIETIEVNDTEPTTLVKKLNEAEKKWVEYYDSSNRLYGYNIQLGGKQVTPEEFILQEKWYEIYEKDRWGYILENIKTVLDSIFEKNGNVGENGEIIKFHLKSSDLTKEERKVWYGYEFVDCCGKKQTFNSFVKNFPYSDYLGDILSHAFEDYYECVDKIIWEQVMKNKDKIIKEWYRKSQ